MHGMGARAGGSVGRQYVTAYRTTTLDEASAVPPTPSLPLLYVRALSPATSSSGANGSKGSDVWVSGRPSSPATVGNRRQPPRLWQETVQADVQHPWRSRSYLFDEPARARWVQPIPLTPHSRVPSPSSLHVHQIDGEMH